MVTWLLGTLTGFNLAMILYSLLVIKQNIELLRKLFKKIKKCPSPQDKSKKVGV